MNKLVYVAAPYSRVPDKKELMERIADFCGYYMIKHPGEYAITGLVHHYAAVQRPELGTDYRFWEEFCVGFIKRSEKLVVLMIDGWDSSTGVNAEINLAKRLNIPIEYWLPTKELQEEREYAKSIYRPSLYPLSPKNLEKLERYNKSGEIHYFLAFNPHEG